MEAEVVDLAAEDDKVEDDPSIGDDDVLYRRLANGLADMVSVDQVTGIRRPTSGAFRPDEDGISVYRSSVLAAADMGPSDVVVMPLNLVIGVEVGDVRGISLGVLNDPWPSGIPDAGHARNAAHALIVGLETLGRNERRRRQQQLSKLPSVHFAYEPG